MVVEDEQDLADLYECWLAEEYEVRVAYSGRAALEAADDAVDAVLLDWKMPGMSGPEVVRSLRDRGGTPAVAVASASSPESLEGLAGLPVDTYLRKPIERDQLRDAVARLLAD